MLDVHAAIGRCSTVEPHSDMPKNGGTSWRVTGPDADGERKITIGVEAFESEKQQRVILCTAFAVEKP